MDVRRPRYSSDRLKIMGGLLQKVPPEAPNSTVAGAGDIRQEKALKRAMVFPIPPQNQALSPTLAPGKPGNPGTGSPRPGT